ncbi:MAG: hypothetical protein ABJN69_09390 [Hellea sp.]
MTAYNIFVGGTPHSVTINPTATLAALRSNLRSSIGSNIDNYDFVYFAQFTQKKTILSDRTIENSQTVASVVFPDSVIILTLTQGNKTDLFGMKTDWLYDRHAGIRIVKNNSDPGAIAANKGKFDPIMLTDIQPSNPSSNAFYQRAVICEKGTVIQFNISSWGAAGYGFSIKSDKETICDGLYVTLGDNPNHQTNTGLRRYQSSKNMIQIESTKTLNIPTSDVIHYQKVTLKTWRVTSYKAGGKTHSSNAQAPVITAPHMAMATPGFRGMGLMKSMGAMGAGGGFDPGPTGGDTYVPGSSVETGAPGRGPAGGGDFGSDISDIKQDDRNTTVLGAVVFYFFVFKDHEQANRVINVLNAPNPNAIG